MKRTDPEYLQLAIQQAWEQNVLLVATKAPDPPQTYEELEELVSAKTCGCFISQDAKELTELISTAEDPDTLVKDLPFEWQVTETQVVGWVYWFLPRHGEPLEQ